MKTKHTSYIFSLFLFLLTLIVLLFKNNLTFINLSNTLFMVALPFIIIGALLWVFASGFFDHFQRSIRESTKRKDKKQTPYMALSEVGMGAYSFWFKIGLPLFILSLLLLVPSFF